MVEERLSEMIGEVSLKMLERRCSYLISCIDAVTRTTYEVL